MKTLLLWLCLFLLFLEGYAQNPYESVAQTINTAEFTEYAPTVSADGKTLYFECDSEG
ncbi:MAG: hypothetical protein MUE85_03085 [Microscillaceae bacterium]|nr:hypothetical protein [Microscillaceae bacterium]